MKESQIKVRAGVSFEGEITVPGDKSISHRAVMLASLSNGTCRITNFLEGEDCRSTLAVMEQLGVKVERVADGEIVIQGCGGNFQAPEADLDCGNSGTTMRILSGILAGQPFRSRLVGDASLSKRPMKRVMEPLTKMGAKLTAEGEGGTPPLCVEGGPLQAISYETPVASAQVKSAILFAALAAEGITTVTEPAASRDHTERMMQYFLVKLRREEMREEKTKPPGRIRVTMAGRQKVESRDFRVPGDISSAAFWLVAAGARPGSRLLVRDVGLNPTRTGILAVLVRMGVRVREVVEVADQGELYGAIDVRGGRLRGTVIEGAEIANVIDELPAIAVAAALAEGETIIRDAAELRVKETDRIAAIANNLRAMGVPVEEKPDGMIITGGAKLKGATVPSFGDHRIAMAFAVAGLFAKGPTIIKNTDCVKTSYPDFEATLKLFQKGGSRQRRTVPVFSGVGRLADVAEG
jgi:3-phosphoshikimate 1-carboxyvinyltransferase